MGRIFLSAGHVGTGNGTRDLQTVSGGTVSAKESIEIRDLVAAQLRSRDLQVLTVPDDLSQVQSIDWINARARTGDVAGALREADAFAELARAALDEVRGTLATLARLEIIGRVAGRRPDRTII